MTTLKKVVEGEKARIIDADVDWSSSKIKFTLKKMIPWSKPRCSCKSNWGECGGPCYDFCACHHCWNGWSTLSFRHRLWHRIQQIWWDFRKRDPWA